MRTRVQRDDPSLAVPLVFDHHESRTLDDVRIVVVGARKYWRASKRQAPDTQPQILRTVEFLTASSRFRVGSSGTDCPPSRLRLRRQRRNSAVWRIDDERRSFVRFHTVLPCVQRVHSGVINRRFSRVGKRELVRMLHALLENLRRLLFRQKLPPSILSRAFHGRKTEAGRVALIIDRSLSSKAVFTSP